MVAAWVDDIVNRVVNEIVVDVVDDVARNIETTVDGSDADRFLTDAFPDLEQVHDIIEADNLFSDDEEVGVEE